MEILKWDIRNLNSWLEGRIGITFIIILVSILFLVAYIFHFLFDSLRINDIIIFKYANQEKNPLVLFVSTVILAPFLETFLCQSLPYKLMRKIKDIGNNDSAILITSASIFGLLHFYSLFYIIYAFFIGMALMYGYMIRVKSDKNAFTLIVISHSVFNLGIMILNFI